MSLDSLLELQPHKAAGFTVAIPKGFVPSGNDPNTLTFDAPAGSTLGISRFRITYLGRILRAQTPEPYDLVLKAVADRKLTALDKPILSPDYSAVVADSGVAGPDRFVNLMFVRHWPMPYEADFSVGNFSSRTGLPTPNDVDLFTAEFTAADASAFTSHAVTSALKAIAWTVSIPSDEVPADQLPGTWNWAGSFTPITPPENQPQTDVWQGKYFQVKLTDAGEYEMRTVYTVTCDYPMACVTEGSAKLLAKGTYSAAGGLLVMRPRSCEYRFYDPKGTLKENSPCLPTALPIVLRLTRLDQGRLRFSGLAASITDRFRQNFWYAERLGTPKPNWPPGPDRASSTITGPWSGGMNICGPVDEKEPNDKPLQATPYLVGQTVSGCSPTWSDRDHYQVAGPGTGSGGYFEGSLTGFPGGGADITVDYVRGPTDDLGRTIIKNAPANKSSELHFAWPVLPSQTFRILMTPLTKQWFQYSLKVNYHPVNDAFEPNDVAAQAKPITVGTPVEAFFFTSTFAEGRNSVTEEADWYTVDLSPGTVTITLDAVPENVSASVSLNDPTNRLLEFLQPATRTPGQPIKQTVPVPAAGTYRLKADGSPKATPTINVEGSVIPANFTKPYRLLVTQP